LRFFRERSDSVPRLDGHDARVRPAQAAAVPACAIGQVHSEDADPFWTEDIAGEVAVVFDFLGLGPVEIKTS